MEEIKLKVVDFAELVGCQPKTVYSKIKSGELSTVNEIQNGRKITLIITNNKQLEDYKNIYGKLPVNDSNCKEILTVNEDTISDTEEKIPENNLNMGDLFEKLITVTENYNNRLMTVNEELMNYKSKIPLLEDKANREGLYLQEIKDLKKVNESNKRLFTVIVITMSLIILTLFIYLVVKLNNPVVIEKTNTIETIKEIKTTPQGTVTNVVTKPAKTTVSVKKPTKKQTKK